MFGLFWLVLILLGVAEGSVAFSASIWGNQQFLIANYRLFLKFFHYSSLDENGNIAQDSLTKSRLTNKIKTHSKSRLVTLRNLMLLSEMRYSRPPDQTCSHVIRSQGLRLVVQGNIADMWFGSWWLDQKNSLKPHRRLVVVDSTEKVVWWERRCVLLSRWTMTPPLCGHWEALKTQTAPKEEMLQTQSEKVLRTIA